MFDNQCGSGFLFPGYFERSSFHVLFCNIPKSKNLCAKSSLDDSFLIFGTVRSAYARSREVWTAGLAERALRPQGEIGLI